MTKLCLIGNSHLAAVRWAWDNIAGQHPAIEADFFSQHTENLVHASLTPEGHLDAGPEPFRGVLAAQKGVVTPQAIDLSGYDAVVLVGLAFGPRIAVQPYRRFTFMGLKRRDTQAISRDQYMTAVRRAARETSAVHLAALLAGRHRLLLVPCALPGERGRADLEFKSLDAFRMAEEADDGAALMALYGAYCAELEKTGVTMVFQPPETVTSGLWTFDTFNKDVVYTRAGSVRPDNDYYHMNADYGALVWREVIAALG